MKKISPRWRSLAWAFVITIIIACAVACAWVASIAKSQYPGDQSQRIYIPAGASASSVADTLTSRLGHEFGLNAYRLWQWQKGKPAKAHGSYVIAPGTSALQVSRMLKGGWQTPVKVTFNNVRTLDEAAERICRNLEISPEQFLDACDSIMGARGVERANYPALLLPDTYEMYWTETPYGAVKRLVQDHDRYWNDERVAAAAALGLTPEQAATLASIVEEETAKADERPMVARLYLNRLDRGMLLQADPTVKFAVGDFALRRLLSAHLKVESPYNTYIHQGLPPGPIRIASKQGIDAVLNPADHQYIYMCAKEDFSGYHNFARTYDQHLANAARYHRAINARGIK